ncbi:hypothetical protein BpHYR1_033328 [Brachionus plicatilis]|uniref:Uncharacterized protein n=1 Tax=Brachionus plicatilis TaxID=10195 RepID=A0A3M7S2S4_BRAPC|nr:hypothetical protein BpHYR1_033328 [Brachionus plicatilis]
MLIEEGLLDQHTIKAFQHTSQAFKHTHFSSQHTLIFNTLIAEKHTYLLKAIKIKKLKYSNSLKCSPRFDNLMSE